jgi:hypothetical protein
MGNSNSFQSVNFEDIQFSLQNSNAFLLINTLKETEQACILPNTLPPKMEIEVINRFIMEGKKDVHIFIYGKNSNDTTIYEKYKQLTSLGFSCVFLYTGGIFEWLMLQDIYGEKEFPTTQKELDFLRFKSCSKFTGQKRLTN